METPPPKRKVASNLGSKLLSLPDELLEIVLSLTSPTTEEMCRLKEVCWRFNTTTRSKLFLANVDLFNMQAETPEARLSINHILEPCYEAGNLSAMYWKALSDIFWCYSEKSGLDLLKKAADGGYKPAMYGYGMFLKAVRGTPEGDAYLSKLGRKKIKEISSQFANAPFMRMMNWAMPEDFWIARCLHDITPVTKCGCTAINDSLPWHADGYLGPNHCISCFWVLEIEKYLQYYPTTAKLLIQALLW